MSKVWDIVSGILPFYICIGLGWLAGRRKLLDHSALTILNAFLMQFAVPALIFKVLAEADLVGADWSGLAADMIYKVVMAVALLAFYWPRYRSLALVEPLITDHLLLTLPNTFIVGVPLLSTMYPPETVELYMSLLLVDQALFSFGFSVLCGEAVRFHRGREAAAGALGGAAPSPVAVTNGHGGGGATEGREVVGQGGEAGPEGVLVGVAVDGGHVGQEMKRASNGQHEEVGERHMARSLTVGMGLYPRGEEQSGAAGGGNEGQPGDGIDLQQVVVKIGSRLSRNPVIHSSILGTAFALAAHWGDFKLEDAKILETMVDTMANCTLGIALFNIGLFGYGRPLVACGPRLAFRTLFLRFTVSPVLMAIPCIALGIKGVLLKIMIMQAALPQAVVSFVISQDYDLSPAIFQTGIVLGTLLSLPILTVAYLLLDAMIDN